MISLGKGPGVSGFETLLTEVADGVLTITLHRPAKLNAYTRTMGAELRAAFERASLDDEVRVIIVTGAGRGFCSGADLSPGQSAFASEGVGAESEGESRPENRFVDAIFNCAKPSIAAINGPAIGVGVTMTLPMDIRIASTEARIGFVFARRGLVLEAGGAWFLPKIVGMPQALRWCYSAKVMDAEEALHGGLVSELVPPEALLPRARELALEIAGGTAPVSIALTRQLLWQAWREPSPMAILEADSRLNRELGRTADVRGRAGVRGTALAGVSWKGIS